jgi:hypothetical protein
MTQTYDPFDNDYKLVRYNNQNKLGAKLFNIGIVVIEDYGRKESQGVAHKVTRTDVGGRFHSAVTEKIELHNCRWLKTRDKWNLTYQIGFQAFEGSDNDHWWRVTRKIIGTRSGKEPRSFEASDFNETQKIFDGLHREISNKISFFIDEEISLGSNQ